MPRAISFGLFAVVAGCARQPVTLSLDDSVIPRLAAVEARVDDHDLALAQIGAGVQMVHEAVEDLRADVEFFLSAEIFFEFDSALIPPDANLVLDEVADRMRAHPATTALLVGSADSRGGRLYNAGLARARGQAVADFLAAEGVAPGRIAVLQTGQTPGVHEAARRVEVWVR